MSTRNRTTHVVEFINYAESIRNALDGIRASDILSKQRVILIKPNLVDSIKFPVTTHRDCVSAIIDYIRNYTDARIIIAEGCGCPNKETAQVFKELGYTELAQEKSVELMDLNKAPLIKLKNPKFKVLPVCYLPEVAMRSFILSVPVLKAHSFSSVTLSLKNMLGFAPPEYYQRSGYWKKSFFHQDMHNSIFELNLYRTPDMVLLDASVGMPDYHLGGRECSPPVNKIIAGTDAGEVDKIGAELLGFDWRDIPHIYKFVNYRGKYL